MSSLSKADFLTKRTLPTETVKVPALGGDVRVRSMTAKERDAFEAGLVKGDGKNRKTDFTNFRAKLCALTLIDDEGNRLFTDDEAEQLGELQAAAIQPIFEVAQRLNGLTQADVEELTKN